MTTYTPYNLYVIVLTRSGATNDYEYEEIYISEDEAKKVAATRTKKIREDNFMGLGKNYRYEVMTLDNAIYRYGQERYDEGYDTAQPHIMC